MALIYILLLIVLFLALYPLIRDALKRRGYPELEFSQSLELILAGKKEEALEKLKGIVKRNSEFIDAYLYLSRLYLEKGDFNTAMAIGERLALRRNLTKDKEKKILGHLAQLFIRGKRYLKAVSVLEELVKMDGDKEAFATLFALYLREENFTAAEGLLSRLEKMARERLPLFYAELGKRLLKKDTKKGLSYLEKGERSENPLPALFYLAEHYAEVDKKLAIATYSKIIEKEPNSFSLFREKMEEIYYALGRFGELEEVYERYIRLYPMVLDFFLALAEIYLKQEMPEEALKVLERYKGEERSHLLNLAFSYLLNGKLDKAKEILEKLISEEAKRESPCPTCGENLEKSSLFCPNCLSWT